MMGDKGETLAQLSQKLVLLEEQREKLLNHPKATPALIERLDGIIARGYRLLPVPKLPVFKS